jgi:hypothetical protein
VRTGAVRVYDFDASCTSVSMSRFRAMHAFLSSVLLEYKCERVRPQMDGHPSAVRRTVALPVLPATAPQ